MSRLRPVRCPSSSCGAVFDLAPDHLGRNVRCPACDGRMTARPVGVLETLAAQEGRLAGGPGSDVPRLPLAALVDNVRSLWNVGSMFRTADACGVELLALAGITGCPPRAEISKTALGAERAVAWRYHADPSSALEWMRSAGYEPVVLELAPGSEPVDEIEWPRRPCLVVGNEVAGVSPPVLDACPRRVHVPMLGVKSSLNVAVAFGIAIYHAARASGRSVARRTGSIGSGRLGTAMVLLAVLSCATPGAAAAAADAAATVTLPHTIERVWMRTGKERGFKRLANASGDLTLTEHGLDYVTRKRSESLPFDDVRVVSLGKMKGDMDTDWIVLELGDAASHRVVGFRDGKKFGYGDRTEAMYRTLREVVRDRQLAQYAVGGGLVVHDALDRQLVLGYPEGWHAAMMSTVVSGGHRRFGRDLFTPEPIRSRGAGDDPPRIDEGALARARSGRMPALVLARVEARRAMGCERGIKPKARAKVVAAVEADPVLGGFEGGWDVEPAELDRCLGLRLRARGGGSTVEAIAAARDGVLYVVGFRGPDDAAEAMGERFRRIVESVRFSVAL